MCILWYNVGMGVGDWITLVAVIVALGIGVASILYTQRLQKKERKERLLNEIIEWAEEIAKFLHGWNVASVIRMYGDMNKRLSQHIDWLADLNNLRVKALYLSKISKKKTFGKGLENCVKEAVNDLDRHSKLFDDWLNDKVSPEEVIKQKSLFYLSVKKVIEEAAKIKTKDVS